MKKIIALVLALIMSFSLVSVAFATDVDTLPEAPETEETEQTDAEKLLGEYSWILDLPAGTVIPAFKIAKIALKFLKVYVKICSAFGLDPLETGKFLFDYIGGVIEDNKDKLPELNLGDDAATETFALLVA